MTKAELLTALEWFKDDAELHIAVHHPALDSLMEVYPLKECRYRIVPYRIELVAGPAVQTAGDGK